MNTKTTRNKTKPSTSGGTRKNVSAPAAAKNWPTAVLARGSKQARLITMLRAKRGATINQMMALTGWQAHSVRSIISGTLRKKLGLNIESQTDVRGIRLYRINTTARAAK